MRSHAAAGALIHRHVDANNVLVDFYYVIVPIKTIYGIYVFLLGLFVFLKMHCVGHEKWHYVFTHVTGCECVIL